MMTVEAVRTAQAKFGKKPMSGEQVRWGLEQLNLDANGCSNSDSARMIPPIKVTCDNHSGSGLVRFQQWDGKQWKSVSGWINGDSALVRKMVEESAAQYAKEKGITPGCMKG